jgi:hypothetical protein
MLSFVSLKLSGRWCCLPRGMATYLAFTSAFPHVHAPDPLFWSHPQGLGLRLIGLSTALLAADDVDRGKLRAGKQAPARTLTSEGHGRDVPPCEVHLQPIALITLDNIVERILSHRDLRTAPEAIGLGGSLGWDVDEEPMRNWVSGMDPKPSDVDVTQRGPA